MHSLPAISRHASQLGSSAALASWYRAGIALETAGVTWLHT